MNQPDPQRNPDPPDAFGLVPGSHLVSPRLAWIHHGLYLGDGQVIHYRGLSRGLCSGPIEEVSLQVFADGHEVSVLAQPLNRQVGQQIIARARTRLGENAYAVLNNNCEHFCNACAWGLAYSLQIEQIRLRGKPTLVAQRLLRWWSRGLVRWLGDLAGSRETPQVV
ncbi:MAG: lecithin retinol acyltransferase family protein [Burkholderiaceae bacterium]